MSISLRETINSILSVLKSTEKVTLDLSKNLYLYSGGLRSKLDIETWERICGGNKCHCCVYRPEQRKNGTRVGRAGGERQSVGTECAA